MSVARDSMSKIAVHSCIYLTQKCQKAHMSLCQKLLIKENCSDNLMLGCLESFV